MLYTKIESEFYNGLPVNWKNDKKHSPLIGEFLDEIFILMNKSITESIRKNIKPVLLRFDLQSYKEIDNDVKKLNLKLKKYHENKNKFFQIYFQPEKNDDHNHYHFIVIVDGKNDYKSYKKFSITMQKIWNQINTEISLYTREENHYYKIWKKIDFDSAFYSASYLAKFRGKEDRIIFRTKKHKSDEERQLSQSDQNNALLRAWEVLAILKISKSTFYAGIKKGIYPKPHKLGSRTSVWKKEEIINLIDNMQVA